MSIEISPKSFFQQPAVADMRLIACPGAEELTGLIDKHLVRWAKAAGIDKDTFIIPSECPRFQSGDAKGLVRESVRGDDIFIVIDPGNYSVTYTLFGNENHMSPDDHFANLKRLIQAVAGKAHRVSVIMPSLYGGRQHRRVVRESLDCAVALQELQTILTNKLPIKIFLINNNGYHSIRLTQNNLFKEHCKVGIGPESGDLSFPEFEKIAKAFGYPYYSAHSNAEMKQAVDTVLALDGPAFCEIFTDTKQVWEPKSSTKRLPDGTLVSPPLEDLAPFLPREELEKQMFIPLMPEV